MRSKRPAPMFCPASVEMAMLSVNAGMKASWSTRLAAPKAAVASSPKPLTIPVTNTMPTEISDCCTAAGAPIRTVSQAVGKSNPRHASDGAAGLSRLRRNHTNAPSASAWAITVATAVPFRPSAGAPSQPNMSTGSRAAVRATAPPWKYSGVVESPMPCNMLRVRNRPKPSGSDSRKMRMYCSARPSTSGGVSMARRMVGVRASPPTSSPALRTPMRIVELLTTRRTAGTSPAP